SRPRVRPSLREVAAQEPPVTPAIAFVKGPAWDQAEEQTQAAFAELVEALGEVCDTVELPEVFANALGGHRTIYCTDLALSFDPFYRRGRDRLSPTLIDMIEEGQRTLALDYTRAVAWRDLLNRGLDEVFERFDAILTPAAPGPAPRGLDSTGNPVFCTLWTFCGTPAVTLPLLQGENGLPIGVQLVGRRHDDARLLRTARWLAATVAALTGASDDED
ncbi:MAG: amidase, partial [Alphaproteobacteria bacterium]